MPDISMAPIDPIVLQSLADLQPALYWLDADPLEPESHSALVGEVSTDLCIVGAGYTGLGVASTRFGASTMLDLLDGIESEATSLQMVKHKPIPFPPEPFRFLFIRLTQWSINRADQNQGKRNLWLKLLDRLGLGFDT